MIKSVLKIARMEFKHMTIYRSNFYLFTLNRVVEVLVYIFVWMAIYEQTGQAGGYTITQMITYYILVVSISPIALWGINEDMAHSIRNGQIDKELLSPVSYFQYYFGMNLGLILFSVFVSIATFAICALFWGVSMPVNLLSGICFFLLVFAQIPITFFLQMIVGLTGFYTSSIWGMQILRKAVISIFSGLIAPLTLFPRMVSTNCQYFTI